ncbi:MAG: DUF3179 domain-containing protein [Proteobacteria bacterium]|nr:DUF3179 domain-containing protein [Pseudomonadota bacterium]
MDGKILHMSAGGLYDGLVLLLDGETKTYWNHITGEALHGPMAGRRLEMWGIEITTVGDTQERYPGLLLLRSKLGLGGRLMSFMARNMMKGKFPPWFRGTMGHSDTRLEEMTMGLGVITDTTKRFYPLEQIRGGVEDKIDERTVQISVDKETGVPCAVRTDGVRPIQLFTRWYGFSYTYPHCDIFQAAHFETSASRTPQ